MCENTICPNLVRFGLSLAHICHKTRFGLLVVAVSHILVTSGALRECFTMGAWKLSCTLEFDALSDDD